MCQHYVLIMISTKFYDINNDPSARACHVNKVINIQTGAAAAQTARHGYICETSIHFLLIWWHIAAAARLLLRYCVCFGCFIFV